MNHGNVNAIIWLETSQHKSFRINSASTDCDRIFRDQTIIFCFLVDFYSENLDSNESD